MWLSSLNQPPNFSCKPIENNASGPTVPASFSNKGFSDDISKNRGMTNAKMHPIKGGKLNTFSEPVDYLIFVVARHGWPQ